MAQFRTMIRHQVVAASGVQSTSLLGCLAQGLHSFGCALRCEGCTDRSGEGGDGGSQAAQLVAAFTLALLLGKRGAFGEPVGRAYSVLLVDKAQGLLQQPSLVANIPHASTE